MRYSEASWGRIFVIRLEHGETVHEQIEQLAKEKSIQCAAVIALGGLNRNSRLVVGPKDGDASPIETILHELSNVHETVGTGTIFPDENGTPILHMHLACGREESTTTGCIRTGVKVWHVLEVVLMELTQCKAQRRLEAAIGLKLLQP